MIKNPNIRVAVKDKAAASMKPLIEVPSYASKSALGWQAPVDSATNAQVDWEFGEQD